jgi:hypothetical protein
MSGKGKATTGPFLQPNISLPRLTRRLAGAVSLFGLSRKGSGMPAVVEDTSLPMSLVTPAHAVNAAINALKFGSRPPSVRPSVRRREAPAEDVQYPLF